MTPDLTISVPTRRPVSGEEERILLAFARFLSKSMSPASVAAYQSDIRLFLESTPGIILFQITKRHEDDYLAWLNRIGLKKRTLKRKGTAFRYFREFIKANGLRGKNLRVPTAVSAVGRKPELGADDLAVLDTGSAIDGLLLTFLRNLQQDRSASTLRAYTSDLLKLRKRVQGNPTWQHVTKQLIEDFISEEIAAGLNGNSSARLLSTIRSFFKWLRSKGHAVGNPTLGLHVPRANKYYSVPAVAELDVMLSTKPSTFQGLRDMLIFELLFRCGLRLSEIAALDILSLYPRQRRIIVRGRRDRRRYLDIPESTSQILTAYLPTRRQIATDMHSGPLVINWRGDRLTVRSIFRIINQLVTSGRLPEGTHPHSLRAAHAFQSLNSGKDLQDIRHDLGISGVSAVLKISN